jgi:hypothetical protein
MTEETQLDGTSTESEEIKDPAAVLAALDRAKKDAKQFREEKEALEVQIDKYRNENAKYSGKLLREKVMQQLAELKLANTDRLFKYLKLDELSFDEELNVIGLEDQIKGIKEDFPELFDPKLLVAGKADSADSTPVDRKISASERQAMAVLGRK